MCCLNSDILTFYDLARTFSFHLQLLIALESKFRSKRKTKPQFKHAKHVASGLHVGLIAL